MNAINPNKPMISTGFPEEKSISPGKALSPGGVRDNLLTVGGLFSDDSVGGVSFDAALVEASLKPDKYDKFIRSGLDFPIPPMPDFGKITD